MVNDRHRRIGEIFNGARGLAPEARRAYLDYRCGGDVGLREEVESLLDHGEGDWWLDEPVAAHGAGQRIGPYELVRRIGVGGMGAVYVARQSSPNRSIALKLVSSTFATDDLLRRFDQEVQLLGRLQHPGIARIFDAGTAETVHGPQPYLAMELIDGDLLTDYADDHELTIRERVNLVTQICDAADHAHVRGVVHRDLKPANILVDRTGTPRILDFGIARATDADVTAVTRITSTGQIVGTVAYMSPEQTSGRSSEVDHRSDVYSIGVVLYQLLTHELPYDLGDSSVHEAILIVRDEEPHRLSVHDRTLRGDLETIVAKALEKDVDRRYQSAAALGQDLRRWLRHEPIVARPASRAYHVRKFVRRNRAVVGGTVAVFLMLIAAVVGTSVGLLEAQRERDEARHQRQVALDVVRFLNEDLLQKADPHRRSGHDATLLSVLDRASESIETRFASEPEVNASIRATLGDAYSSLQQYDAVIHHTSIAAELFETTLGPDAEVTLTARRVLARAYNDLRRFDEAEPILDDTLRRAERALGAGHELVGLLRGDRGLMLKRRGQYVEAEQEYRSAIDILTESVGPTARPTLVNVGALGLLLANQERFGEAEECVRAVVDGYTGTQGERHADTAHALINLGHVLWMQGKLDEAEPLWRRAYEVRVDLFGDVHPLTLNALYAIGLVHSDRGEYDKAFEIATRVHAGQLEGLPPGHSQTLSSHNSLGVIRERQRRFEEAAAIYREVTAEATASLGITHADTHRYRTNLLSALRALDDQEGIEAVYRDHFDRLREMVAGDVDGGVLNHFAWHLITCEVRSLRDYEEGLAIAERAVHKTNRHNQSILDTYAHALAENDRFDEAIAAQREAIALVDERNDQLRASLQGRLEALLERQAAQ